MVFLIIHAFDLFNIKPSEYTLYKQALFNYLFVYLEMHLALFGYTVYRAVLINQKYKDLAVFYSIILEFKLKPLFYCAKEPQAMLNVNLRCWLYSNRNHIAFLHSQPWINLHHAWCLAFELEIVRDLLIMEMGDTVGEDLLDGMEVFGLEIDEF